MPTASMGDIAFLLIIFFMVCSNFTESDINYMPPKASHVETLQSSGVSVVMDKDGRLYLNARPMESTAALKTELETIFKSRTDPTKREVLFKCDVNLARNVFEPALSAIVGAGGIVLAVGDKRKGD